jgi:hypothetical protein
MKSLNEHFARFAPRQINCFSLVWRNTKKKFKLKRKKKILMEKVSSTFPLRITESKCGEGSDVEQWGRLTALISYSCMLSENKWKHSSFHFYDSS